MLGIIPLDFSMFTRAWSLLKEYVKKLYRDSRRALGSEEPKSCRFSCILDGLLRLIYLIFQCLAAFVAPLALLLKLRQINPVIDLYFYEWDIWNWLQFLGFLNNLKGLTSVIGHGLSSFLLDSVLYTHRDPEREYREVWGWIKYRKSLMSLVAAIIWKQKGFLWAFLILNDWKFNPDMIKTLMRGQNSQKVHPKNIGESQDKENSAVVVYVSPEPAQEVAGDQRGAKTPQTDV